MTDALTLLKQELEETRHRLLVIQQALTIAEQALEESATQSARDALRAIHAVLDRAEQVDKGS